MFRLYQPLHEMHGDPNTAAASFFYVLLMPATGCGFNPSMLTHIQNRVCPRIHRHISNLSAPSPRPLATLRSHARVDRIEY